MQQQSCFAVVVVVVACVIVLSWEMDQCDAQNISSTRALIRRRLRARTRPVSEGLNNDIHRAYVNAVTNDDTSPSYPNGGGRATPAIPAAWAALTPSLPSASEIDCHVEVRRVDHHNGRCMKLGSASPQYICQSGAFIEMKPQCESIINNRQQQNGNDGAADDDSAAT